jgi:hypothetical protein
MSNLTKAILIWSQGQNISLVLAAALMREGYDVVALEARHRL